MPTPAELSELVFIYGDLRRGCSQAFRMEGAEYLRKAEVAGVLLEISGVPGLVPRRGGERGWVAGDLFQTSLAHLEALDALEEPGVETSRTHYRRVRMKVYQPASTELLGEAWVWEWTRSRAGWDVVRSGDWMEVARPRCAPWFTLLAAGCLIGFFPSLGILVISPHKPAPTFADQLMGGLVLIVPLVAAVSAWWGFRRRERCEVLAVLLLLVSTVLAILALVVLAWLLAEYFR